MFGAVDVLALIMIPYLGRREWFFHDDWEFLANRTGGNLGDLFRPLNEHWTTLPILAYRGMWQVFGLRTYMPYLVCDVALHVTLAVLLFVLMRKCGVRAWLATAAGSLFVLFGSGYQDSAKAFQITFVGALVFGFAQAIAADHEGPIGRRDVLGVVAGVAGLMCSGIALPMVVVVGVGTLLHRGARVALFHVLPLVVVYGIWYSAIGRTTGDRYAGPGEILGFVFVGVRAVFGHLGQVPGVGALLFVVLVAGSILAWQGPFRPRAVPTATASSVALLVGMLAFLALTGASRAAGSGIAYAEASRYLDVGAALLLVPLAVAAEAIVERRRHFLIPVIALFAIGIPGNVVTLVRFEHVDAVFQENYEQKMLWIPHLENVQLLPRTLRPETQLAQPVTLGWLLDATAEGKVPDPRPNSPRHRSEAQQEIVLAYSSCMHAHPPCRAAP